MLMKKEKSDKNNFMHQKYLVMRPELQTEEWKIVENSFLPEQNRASESIFSIGNGKMGQRANFEESYSGDSLQGNYLAGI